MNQKAYLNDYRPSSSLTARVTPEEYRMLHKKTKIRWKFKPKSIWALMVLGILIFALLRIILFPLVEGIFNYTATTNELKTLKSQYYKLDHQLTAMSKTRDYMMTPAYIEERGHQIGMVKENEMQMVVVDASDDDDLSKLVSKRKKPVEIGD